jgi:hypothetical protein
MGEASSSLGVLLVGSIPLSTTEEVFATVCKELPGRLRTIPDGETGVRDTYVFWQRDCFPVEARRMIPLVDGIELPEKHPGFTQESVKPTGYDDAAIRSYKAFADLQKQGVIPQDVRFQVSLPIPNDAVQFFVRDEWQGQLFPFYERRIQEAVRRIVNNIPAERLAIQWDIALLGPSIEYRKGRVGVLPAEIMNPAGRDVKEEVMATLARLCEVIPTAVHVGLHLCYGDLHHRHTIEPEDMAILVDIANTAVSRVKRSIEWVHMPVPKDKESAGYFKPLQQLSIGNARLYLGLVHADDEEGTRRRIAAAQSVGVKDFGVATECGMGRTPREQLESILQISRDVTKPAEVSPELTPKTRSKRSWLLALLRTCRVKLCGPFRFSGEMTPDSSDTNGKALQR